MENENSTRSNSFKPIQKNYRSRGGKDKRINKAILAFNQIIELKERRSQEIDQNDHSKQKIKTKVKDLGYLESKNQKDYETYEVKVTRGSRERRACKS